MNTFTLKSNMKVSNVKIESSDPKCSCVQGHATSDQ